MTNGIYPIEWAEMTKERAGQKYQPSNGTEEEWKPLVGFESIYKISDTGRIVTLLERSRYPAGLELIRHINRNGYLRVGLTDDFGKKKYFYVHRLVALTFIGHEPEGCEVNHKDSNRLNPCAQNLEYVTHSENVRHMLSAGRFDRKKASQRSTGSMNSAAKLSDRHVLLIKRLLPRKIKHAHIARFFGISKSTVSHIATGRKWTHVTAFVSVNGPLDTVRDELTIDMFAGKS